MIDSIPASRAAAMWLPQMTVPSASFDTSGSFALFFKKYVTESDGLIRPSDNPLKASPKK